MSSHISSVRNLRTHSKNIENVGLMHIAKILANKGHRRLYSDLLSLPKTIKVRASSKKLTTNWKPSDINFHRTTENKRNQKENIRSSMKTISSLPFADFSPIATKGVKFENNLNNIRNNPDDTICKLIKLIKV